MDKFTLLAANAVTLTVFAVSYAAAFHNMKGGRYWRIWIIANLVIAGALVFYISEAALPAPVVFLVPNGLLLIGFALHWNAARQFNRSRASRLRLWLPPVILCLTSVPAILSGTYGMTYTITNIMLAFLAFGTAREYARGTGDRLSSRHGLTAAYGLICLSFSVRIVQGFAEWQHMGIGLPDDLLLTFHLIVALVYVSASGAFTLALAFERAVAEQRDAAHRDPLTGVFNRREFELRLKSMLKRERRSEFAVLQFDLDHFKRVNDRFGHVAGDEALKLSADLIRWCLRDEDCLARLGGEEFAALLPDISREDAIRIAESIRETVAGTPLDFAPGDFRLTVSAGVYHGTGDDMCHKGLMRRVDEGLYQSKNAGRNRISVASAA